MQELVEMIKAVMLIRVEMAAKLDHLRTALKPVTPIPEGEVSIYNVISTAIGCLDKTIRPFNNIKAEILSDDKYKEEYLDWANRRNEQDFNARTFLRGF